MITEKNNIEKICSFYVSDFHLEMIMLPYINDKIDKKANIAIITEKNLTETVQELISKINLTKEKKEKILNLGWTNSGLNTIKIDKKSKGEKIVFIIGSRNYIDNVNKNIEEKIKDIKIKIINCYDLAEIQKDITEIVSQHSKVLNTVEEKELQKNY